MLKLEATLIATRVAGPRPNGWSLENGVNFIVWAPTRQGTIIAPVDTVQTVTRELASFLEADDIPGPGLAIMRRYVSLAAQAAEAEAAARDSKDTPLTRAWSSVSRKVPGS